MKVDLIIIDPTERTMHVNDYIHPFDRFDTDDINSYSLPNFEVDNCDKFVDEVDEWLYTIKLPLPIIDTVTGILLELGYTSWDTLVFVALRNNNIAMGIQLKQSIRIHKSKRIDEIYFDLKGLHRHVLDVMRTLH